ncbi:MAG: hypothetical protein PHY31_08300 [Smithellaceae bacterium]|nr:hypothetical protein [Smithellaceae bacterium]
MMKLDGMVLRHRDTQAALIWDQFDMNELSLPNNRLKLTAHLVKILSARS